MELLNTDGKRTTDEKLSLSDVASRFVRRLAHDVGGRVLR